MPFVHRSLGISFVLALIAAVVGVPMASGQTAQGPGNGRVIVLQNRSGIGVTLRDVTDEDAKAAHLPTPIGAYVREVSAGSAADKAGIKADDIVVEFDGQAVRGAAMLARLVSETPAGRTVKVVVLRDAKRVDLSVTTPQDSEHYSLDIPSWAQPDVRLRPPILRWQVPDDEQQSTPRFSPPPGAPRFAPPLWQYGDGPQLGVTVLELTPQLRDYFGVRQGVLVSSVAADSGAARAGLKAGDVITTLDKVAVRTSDDLRRYLEERRVGDRVTLSIVRDRKPMTVTVTLEAPRTRVRPI